MNNKKEFTKEELYEYMKYIIYCLEVEIDIKSCSSRENYEKFLKGTEKHCGDCTKENCTCQKCFFNSIEITAQNITDYLLFDDEEEEPIPPDTEDINESDVSPDIEKEEYICPHKELEKIIKATKILIEKYPEEFKKIRKEI